MSTIYTIAAQSVLASAGGTDLMLIHSSTEGRTARATMTVVRTYVLGASSTQTLGFFGATATTRPTAAAEADILSTSATSTISGASTVWGYGTSTQANGVITLLRALRADLVALGLINGS